VILKCTVKTSNRNDVLLVSYPPRVPVYHYGQRAHCSWPSSTHPGMVDIHQYFPSRSDFGVFYIILRVALFMGLRYINCYVHFK
jgi:hypothetical protein